MDQEKDLANKQIKLKAKEDLTASKLQGRLNQIRIQLGVPQQKGGVKQELKAVIRAPIQSEDNQMKKTKPQQQVEKFKLQDIKLEEDHDQEMIKIFMKKTSRVWKSLFT